MQLANYGIILTRLQAADLETVRNWRNAAHVRPYMQHQEFITADMQQAWFRALDRSLNYYFIIQQDKKKIGLINLKDLDPVMQSAEAGIFIGDPGYLNSMVPVLATISLMEFAFETLHLKQLKAKINSSNTPVIAFNQSIGYQKMPQQQNNDFHYYAVTHDDFLKATKRLRSTLDKLK